MTPVLPDESLPPLRRALAVFSVAVAFASGCRDREAPAESVPSEAAVRTASPARDQVAADAGADGPGQEEKLSRDEVLALVRRIAEDERDFFEAVARAAPDCAKMAEVAHRHLTATQAERARLAERFKSMPRDHATSEAEVYTAIIGPSAIRFMEASERCDDHEGFDAAMDLWRLHPEGAAGRASGNKVREVTPSELEARRIRGQWKISPDPADRAAIAKSGRGTAAVMTLCLDASGRVDKVEPLSPSEYPDYDAKLMSEIKTWAFRPFIVDGKAVPVCSTQTFTHEP
jgi:hypothetical protein